MRKRLLITGASGFIGRYILKNLQQQAHNLDIYSGPFKVEENSLNLSFPLMRGNPAFDSTGFPRIKGNDKLDEFLQVSSGLDIYCLYKNHKLPEFGNDFCWVQADLLDEQNTKKMISEIKPNYLIHLGWYVEHKNFWSALENYDWLIASELLLKYFKENGGEFFIGAGTFCEYLITQKAGDNNYTKCKNLLYNFVQNYCDTHGINYAWCRIFSAFGNGEPQAKLITSTITKLMNDQKTSIGNPNNLLDFIYVDDITKIILDVLFKQRKGIVDIGTGHNISIKNICLKIADILEKDKYLIDFNEQNDNIISIKADEQNIKEKDHQAYIESRLKIMINNIKNYE